MNIIEIIEKKKNRIIDAMRVSEKNFFILLEGEGEKYSFSSHFKYELTFYSRTLPH